MATSSRQSQALRNPGESLDSELFVVDLMNLMKSISEGTLCKSLLELAPGCLVGTASEPLGIAALPRHGRRLRDGFKT